MPALPLISGRARVWCALGVLAVLGGASGSPVPVDGGNVFTAISAGTANTCGFTTSHALLCWGGVYLGSGMTTSGLLPTPVSGSLPWP